MEPVFKAVNNGILHTEALAALAVWLGGHELEADISRAVQRVVEELGLPSDRTTVPPLSDSATAMLSLAAEFSVGPAGAGRWHSSDPRLLDTIGRISGEIAPVLSRLVPGLARPDASFLDVGTGAGWIGFRTAEAHPTLHVTGIDIHQPALEIARELWSPLGARMELRRQNLLELSDTDRFDAIFLPLPFVPRETVVAALPLLRVALKPGGTLVAARFSEGQSPLSKAVVELRTVKCGGHVWKPGEFESECEVAELGPIARPERDWPVPMELSLALKKLG